MLHIKSIDIVGGVSLLDLGPHHCRFPIDGGFFCGGTRRGDSSYCPHHHAIAYVKADKPAFASGGFMAQACHEPVVPREAMARTLVSEAPPAPALVDTAARDALLRGFYAARGRMREAAQKRLADARPPQSNRYFVACREYAVPVESEDDHAASEEIYLAMLASQCPDVILSLARPRTRGYNYAIYLRNQIAAGSRINLVEMLARRRTVNITRPRQLAMFVVAKATTMSLPDIGRRVFGGFDHTTVLHGRDKIGSMISAGSLPKRLASILEELCSCDEILAAEVASLRAGCPQS